MTHAGTAPSYDAVPYVSMPFLQSHPGRLAAVSRLFRFDPTAPDPARARVLEIGCGQGENLLPLALSQPGAEFLGLDLSRRQIGTAEEARRELGAGNLRFVHGDLLELPADLGEFDYILAHGVYSWIPAEARDALLRAIRRHLRGNGLAYVSYNTLPGWHMRRAVRDALLYHVCHVEDPQQRLREGAAFLGFLHRHVPDGIPGYKAVFRTAAEATTDARSRAARLFHDYMEETNEPVHFHRFAEHLGGHGLRFVAEAEIADMMLGGFDPEVERTLAGLGEDLVRREQYLDFLKNRVFRQSIVAHAETRSGWRADPDAVRAVPLCGRFRHEGGEAALRGNDPVVFRDPRGNEGAVRHPLSKAALALLTEAWPDPVPFDELVPAARRRLVPGALVIQPGSEFERDTRTLAEDLFHALAAGMLEPVLGVPPVFRTVSERPRAAAWARLQVRRGGLATNQRHHAVEIGDLDRRLLPLLDGTRDLPALARELAAIARAEDLAVVEGGTRLREPEEMERALASRLPTNLRNLAGLGLLEA